MRIAETEHIAIVRPNCISAQDPTIHSPSLKTPSMLHVDGSAISPNCVSICDKTFLANADCTTFVRSRQSIQLYRSGQAAEGRKLSHLVRNAPVCSLMASPCNVQRYPMMLKSSSSTNSEIFSHFIPWHLAWKSKSLYLVVRQLSLQQTSTRLTSSPFVLDFAPDPDIHK
jgi:hypothetical protein